MGAGSSQDPQGKTTPRKRLLITFATTPAVFGIEIAGSIITGSSLLVEEVHRLFEAPEIASDNLLFFRIAGLAVVVGDASQSYSWWATSRRDKAAGERS